MKEHIVYVTVVLVSTMLSGCSLVDKAASKHISPQAIDTFITIDKGINASIDEYCGSEQNLDMTNLTENIWWPGCGYVTSFDDFDNCEGGCITKDMVKKMSDFNKKYPGKKVHYKSREGIGFEGKKLETITLGGWWLPAPNASDETPRIVVQHGFVANSNGFRTIYLGYLLRKNGFSVLLNNLRDHCYSGASKERIIEWGHAYPYDVLGAWDYATEVDGSINASMVGILGYSMGGFATLDAFALEGSIPGAWIDSAPLTPRAGFEVGFTAGLKKAFKEKVGKHLAGRLTGTVWKDIGDRAKEHGVDLEHHLPEEELPKGPHTARKLFVTANKKDNTVNFTSSEKLAKLIKGLPDQYTLEELWLAEGDCNGQTHVADMFTHSDTYEKKLCEFWSGVFGTKTCDVAEAESKSSRLYAAPAEGAHIFASPFPVSPILAALFASLFVGGLVVTFARYRVRSHYESCSIHMLDPEDTAL